MQCNRTTSLNEFFELINHNVTYVSLLGCGCSPATVPVAEISHYWNIPQVCDLVLITYHMQVCDLSVVLDLVNYN